MADPLDALDEMADPRPAATENYDQAANRVAQVSRQQYSAKQQWNRAKAEDLSNRGVAFTNTPSGDVSEVTDWTGSPLTQADKTNKIAYDSTGTPVDYSPDASGAPKLRDPFEGLPTTTDEKTGDQYQIRKGLPWKWTGQDQGVVQANQDKQTATLDRETSAALAPEEAQAGRQARLAFGQAKLSAKNTALALNGMGVPLMDDAGQPIDLKDPDIPSLKGHIDQSFNQQYAAPEANAKPIFGGGPYTKDAAALRKSIDDKKQQAMELADQHGATVQQAKDAAGVLDNIRQQRQTLQANRLDTINAKRVAAGMQPVTVPGIPGLDGSDAQSQATAADGHSAQGEPATPIGVVPGIQQPEAQPQGATVAGDAHNVVSSGSIPGPATSSLYEISKAVLGSAVDAMNPLSAVSDTAKTFGREAAGAVAEGVGSAVSGAAEFTKQRVNNPLDALIPGLSKTIGIQPLQPNPTTEAVFKPLEVAGQTLKDVPGVITDPMWHDSGAAKAGRLAGGIAGLVAQGAVAPESLVPTLFAQGYAGQYDAAKAHAEQTGQPFDEETAHKAGVIGGGINAILGVPLQNYGKVAAALFGKADTNVVRAALDNAYDAGGAKGVATVLNKMRAYLEQTAGAESETLFKGAAIHGLENVIKQLNTTTGQRVANVAGRAVTDAALGAGTQLAQNVTTRLYDKDKPLTEGVAGQAATFAALGGIFGTIHQVGEAGKAAEARGEIARALQRPEIGGEPPAPGAEGATPKPPKLPGIPGLSNEATNQPVPVEQPVATPQGAGERVPASAPDASQEIAALEQTIADKTLRMEQEKREGNSLAVPFLDKEIADAKNQLNVLRSVVPTAATNAPPAPAQSPAGSPPSVDQTGTQETAGGLVSSPESAPVAPESQRRSPLATASYALRDFDASTENQGSLPADENQLMTQQREALQSKVDAARKPLEPSAPETTSALSPPVTDEVAAQSISTEVKPNPFHEKLQRMIQRRMDEENGKAAMDDMIENDVSPREVVRQFWGDTWPKLNEAQQRRFERMITSVTGFRRGDVVGVRGEGANREEFIAHQPSDMYGVDDASEKAEHLEGTERGLIVLMHLANEGAGQMKEASAKEAQPMKQIGQKTPAEPLEHGDEVHATLADGTEVKGIITGANKEGNAQLLQANGETVTLPEKYADKKSDAMAVSRHSPPGLAPQVAEGDATRLQETPQARPAEKAGLPSPEGQHVAAVAKAALKLHADSLKALGHPQEFETSETRSPSGIETHVDSQRIRIDPEKLVKATAKMTPQQRATFIKRAVGEEVIHLGTVKYANESPANKAKLLALAKDKESAARAKEAYGPEFDDLGDFQKSAEIARMLIQGPEDLTEASYVWLKDFLKWLTDKLKNLPKDAKEVVDGIRKKLGRYEESQKEAHEQQGPPPDTQRPSEGTGEAPREKAPAEVRAVGDSAQFNDIPIEEVPLAKLSLSKDVPQFKAGANERGVVEQLKGKFDRVGTGPIQVWRRLDGSLEAISGRHRLELARRSGETSIPAQIHDESKGFTQQMAARLDAHLNIRDGNGTVADYASYFRHSDITKAEAEATGLLGRAKGQAGFSIGKNASDDLFAIHSAGKINDAKAQTIAEGAPGNAGVQRIGIKAALEEKSADYIRNYLKAYAARTEGANAKQLDLLGSDDSAMREMDAQAKVATQAQQDLSERIRAVENAAKNPDKAKEEGVNVKDPTSVLKRIEQLKAERERWQNWPMHSDLVAKTRDAELPKLKPGQKSAELLQGDNEPFNLVSETAKDKAARLAREQADANAKEASDAADAKTKQDKEQGNLFAANPDREEGVRERQLKLIASKRPLTSKEHAELVALQHPVKLSNARMSNGPQNITLGAANPLTAHHGTPHEVDKFSTEKIGTGEGAQVYGWGLYFAENPAVAKDYAEKLSRPGVNQVKLFASRKQDLNAWKEFSKDKPKQADSFQEEVEDLAGRSVSEDDLAVELQNALGGFRKYQTPLDGARKTTSDVLNTEGKNNTYTVHIDAEADELLDWDKDISKQPKISAALSKIDPDLKSGIEDELDNRGYAADITALDGSKLYQTLRRFAEEGALPGMRDEESEPQAVSNYLHRLGIPGIRYLDQGSRLSIKPPATQAKGHQWEVVDGAGNLKAREPSEESARAKMEQMQSRNYVMFSDDKIKITHKNGQSVGMKDVLGASNPDRESKEPTEGETLGAANPLRTIAEKTPGLDILRDTKEGVQSLLLPSAKSPEHLKAAEVVGARIGEMHRRQESDIHQAEPEKKLFERMGVANEKTPLEKNPGVTFMSAVSTGKPMSPELQKIADEKVTAPFDKREKLMEEAGVPMEKVREHYFPGIWQRDPRMAFNQAMEEAQKAGTIPSGFDINASNPAFEKAISARVKEILDKGEPGSDSPAGAEMFAKRPMQGKASFKNQKVFDDIMTGVKYGLKPASNNPIVMRDYKLAEMDRFIMAHQVFGDFEKSGDLINVDNSGVPMKKALQSGFDRSQWEKINDKHGDIWRRDPDTGALIKQGERWAKKPAAEIINNYLSSSLYNNRYFGSAYKAWMGMANLLNQSQLGVGSAFHAGFTAIESQVSAGANVLKDIYGLLRGNRSGKNALKTFGRLFTAIVENPMTGDKVLNAWRNPDGTMSPEIEKIARAWELSGGGFQMEKGLQTSQLEKLYSDWFSDHKIRAAMRSPVAFVELMAKPIMEWLVPRQKAGVFAHMAQRIYDQNPGKTPEQLQGQFRAARMRVDARLGQVRYDTLFMNNVAKNVVQGLVRAPGWSGGTIAELGGSFKDTGKFFKEWGTTGKLPKDLPDRVAYTAALLVGVAAINAALTYLFTGQQPKGNDYMAFRTGREDENGNPERFMLPSYMKDVWAYSQHPGQTLINKSHPLLSLFGELIKNKDYYGVQVRDTDASALKQAEQAGLHVIKAFEPFWMRGAQTASDRGKGWGEKLAPLIGITPAPKEMNQSPAYRLAAQINRDRLPSAPITEQQAEHRIARSAAVRGLRHGDSAAMQKALQSGSLKSSDVRSIQQKAALPPLASQVKSLPLDQAERVWKVSTPEERRELTPIMEAKRNRVQDRSRMFAGF